MISGEGNPAPPTQMSSECGVADLIAGWQEYMDEAAAAARAQNDSEGDEGHLAAETAPLISPDQFPPVDCTSCGGTVRFDESGSIVGFNCVSSGSCEKIWSKLYPENYIGEEGVSLVPRILPCQGLYCKARLRVRPEQSPRLRIVGKCAVDAGGKRWREMDRGKGNNTKPFQEMRDDAMPMGEDPTALSSDNAVESDEQ